MTETELKELLPEVARTCRGYVDWREKEIARQAWSNNTTVEEEAAELRAQWVRVLERVDIEAARIVLRRIEAGQLDVPGYDFGKLPAIIRRESHGFTTRLQTPAHKFREEPTYRCLSCRDTAIVEIINPAWIRQHIEQIEAGLPDGWFADGRRWCREHNVGPLKATVVCHCEHHQAIVQRDRLDRFRRNELPKDDLPARRDVFNSKSMPAIHTGSLRIMADDLREWIKSYEPMAYAEWTPDPEEYERQFV